MKIKLEKLIKEGWEKVENFGGCEIYGKEKKRILYNPIREEVIMRYNTIL